MIDKSKFELVNTPICNTGKKDVLWLMFSYQEDGETAKKNSRMGVAVRKKIPTLLFKMYISPDGKKVLIEPQAKIGPGVMRITNKGGGSFTPEPANTMLIKRNIQLPAYYEGKWSEPDGLFVFELFCNGAEIETNMVRADQRIKSRRKSLEDMLPKM